uniref:MHC class I-like antigen recognition-like domain-containing protein n=1 Tax=Naja naja TaxID=35670 RepID=A0A8C6XDN8_NAJNA
MLFKMAPPCLWPVVSGRLPSASSHSLKYFYTGISEPSQGQPHFVVLGFVDSQAFVHYDSNSRRMKPRVSWMEKVGKEDPQYWERETQASYVQEQASRQGLETLRNRYHQSEGERRKRVPPRGKAAAILFKNVY